MADFISPDEFFWNEKSELLQTASAFSKAVQSTTLYIIFEIVLNSRSLKYLTMCVYVAAFFLIILFFRKFGPTFFFAISSLLKYTPQQ